MFEIALTTNWHRAQRFRSIHDQWEECKELIQDERVIDVEPAYQ